MSLSANQILKRVDNLHTHRRGERRAPHKPLLLLLALARLKVGEDRIKFSDIEEHLRLLLNTYAPPVSNRHQPELPYWHLQSDELWSVENARDLPRQKGGFPKISSLRKTSAGFPNDVADTLQSEDGLVEQIIHAILEEHFPTSMHEDIIAAVGLGSVDSVWQVREPSFALKKVRARDPNFRKKVLRAYEHRCAITGFRAALGGSYFGCEAGHVQWHAFGGPDTVENGICLEPTIHKLFDAGAWTLTDDHRILVSADYTGSDTAVGRLREHHGKPIRRPIAGEPLLGLDHIKWHRESSLGGVFRSPALAL